MNFGDDRLPTAFWDKTSPCPMSGCWLWTAFCHKGYGRFGNASCRRAHVIAYVALVGRVPGGKILDHKCRTRCCVNPMHLEPVTQRVNVLRGIGPSAKNAAKTHCPRGHLYADGSRRCGVCRRSDEAKMAHARKEREKGRRIRRIEGRKQYRCSLCRDLGHNAATCPDESAPP